jgi:transmembrane sensor
VEDSCGVLKAMTDHLPPSNAASGADQWDAIARFLSGDSTPAEAAETRRWLADHPPNADVVAALDALLPVPPAASGADTQAFTSAIDVEGALRLVHARMDTPVLRSIVGSARSTQPAVSWRSAGRTRTQHVWWRSTSMIAAAALVAFVGLTSWNRYRTPVPTSVATYNTHVGAADSITLPDSSRVILAPGSRLVVAANYGVAARDVELQGAAQFTVRHDTKHPFTVRAGAAVIRDIGTTFAVKSMAGDGISVAVSEGSVSLSDSTLAGRSRMVELKAGDRGRLMSDGSIASQRGAVTPDEVTSISGNLSYRDAPLSEVQADLLRWYGVVLIVRDSVWATQSVTTNGSVSEPVGKILERMATIHGGVVTQKGDTAFIDRPGERARY